MSYGIEIFNANSNIIIDSGTTNTGFIVADTGTANQVTNINLEEEFLFVRPNTTSGNHNITLHRQGTYNQAQTVIFRNQAGSQVSLDYVRGKFASDFTSSSTGYGVQVFNSDGDLAFDSGLYTGDGGFGVTNYFASQSLSGDHGLMDSDTTKYVLGNTLFGSTNNTGFYIGVHFVNSHTSTTAVSSNGVYFHGYFNFFGGSSIVNNIGAQFLGEGGSV